MPAHPAVVRHWGSTPAERLVPQPCDGLLPEHDAILWRAVAVAAPAATTFRWLCQMRAAPYSYDWIDNRGRRSPQELTPGLEDLEPGQRINTIFRITAFEPGHSITMLTRSRVLGAVACTYRADADPADDQRSRIVVKFVVRYPRGAPLGPLMRLGLAPGDLVMMRRQLLNLKGLAERTR